jgi:PTS system D-glucosamine-specific IIC component
MGIIKAVNLIFDYIRHDEEENKEAENPDTPAKAAEAGRDKGSSGKKADSGKRVPLYSPFNGKVESIEHAPDVTFAQKMIGDGFMVMPTNGEVLAPCDLDVAFVFPTGHAVGLKTADGTEFMLHIGVDTVKLEGKGFEPLVKDGDHVKRGQKLMQFDLEYVKANAVSEACMVIYTALPEGASVEVPEEKEIKALDHAADLIGV